LGVENVRIRWFFYLNGSLPKYNCSNYYYYPTTTLPYYPFYKDYGGDKVPKKLPNKGSKTITKIKKISKNLSFKKIQLWAEIKWSLKSVQSSIIFLPNKHFGTKVRTMVWFFVPLWSQSSQQKAFPSENFSKSKKYLSTFHLMIFACQVDIEPD
jgi:hypothetical protein